MDRRDFFKMNTLAGIGLVLAPSLIFSNTIEYYKPELPLFLIFYIENNKLEQRALMVSPYHMTKTEFLRKYSDTNNHLFIYEERDDHIRAIVLEKDKEYRLSPFKKIIV